LIELRGILTTMHSTMAIRANGSDPSGMIRPAVRTSSNVMRLQVGDLAVEWLMADNTSWSWVARIVVYWFSRQKTLPAE